MNWISGLQSAIDYIEDHLTEELDYAEIARKAYSSSFHFQRVFGILCGYTLGEYIRNRRLTRAAEDLLLSDVKVIDVALQYGYDSPESFSRAFARFHGVTPSQAKKERAALKSFSRLSVKLILAGGNVMDYRMEKTGPMELVMKKERFTGGSEVSKMQIPALWDRSCADGTVPMLCR
ncbi:AraC family transcriptional regulator, partial [Blautia wexlerae]|nr:AraC family transcriptional regulator [Blautia wexlerae]